VKGWCPRPLDEGDFNPSCNLFDALLGQLLQPDTAQLRVVWWR